MAFSAEENAAIRETLLREARRCAVTLGLRKTSDLHTLNNNALYLAA